MNTTYKKNNDLYLAEFEVAKIHCEYTGTLKYTFGCNILTADNKTLRCAVGLAQLPQLLLAQQGDILQLSLVCVYPHSKVLAVSDCQNLSRHFNHLPLNANSGLGLATYDYRVEDVILIQMPFEIWSGTYIPQDKYFCILKGQDGSFIAFRACASFVEQLSATQKGDIVHLVAQLFSEPDDFLLHSFKNNSRPTEPASNLLQILL